MSQEPEPQSEASVSSSLSEDSCAQRKAIPLEEMHMEGEEQLEAYHYLMSVRQQALTIKTKTKLIQKKNRKKQTFPESQSPTIKKQPVCSWLKEWSEEVIQNWKCVVANVAYLKKNNPAATEQRIDLSSKPMIYTLSSLSVGRVQVILREIAEQYYSKGGKYFYLWVYALLAVHQASSPYTNFESLAGINACIEAETGGGSGVQVECLIVCSILQGCFQQNHQKRLAGMA